MDYLSIAAIVKDEAPYLREWIEYHRIVGVERFYIIDNGSQDGTLEILQAYQREGIVHSATIEGSRKQMLAYVAAARHADRKTEWLAFIDADEFLLSPACPSLPAAIEAITQRPENRRAAGLVAHWRLFGSSGHESFDGTLVTERFTKAAAEFDPHVKTIARPGCIKYFFDPYAGWYSDRHFAIDEDGRRIRQGDPHPEPAVARDLRINHYVTKSRGECTQKVMRSRADNGEMRDAASFFVSHDRNDIEDLAIQVYLPELKKRLGVIQTELAVS
ncbi:MAG TPA: glycosyltransferase family 2 protein [Terriglobia bacterium]|nr:glycosyltransferase family 2 protein [Terriglobia bacterium]